MPTEAVIFDIDGTLLDSVDLHAKAWQEAFFRFGKDIAYEKIRNQIGKGGDQLMPVFLSEEELDTIAKPLEEYRGDLWKQSYIDQVKPFPCVRQLFERFKADQRKLALATSAKKEELEHYKQLLQIADLLDAGTSADDAEKSKPHPDIFLATLEHLGIKEGGSAVVVGDTPYDIEAASRAGLHTIAVEAGGFPEVDLRGAGAIAVFRDPEDMLKHYADLPV